MMDWLPTSFWWFSHDVLIAIFVWFIKTKKYVVFEVLNQKVQSIDCKAEGFLSLGFSSLYCPWEKTHPSSAST